MAQNQDPLEALIADGRVKVRPVEQYGMPTILSIDLDALGTTLNGYLQSVYLSNNRLKNEYPGSAHTANNQITTDIASMVDFLLGAIYNRLRTVLETFAPNERTTRMNPRCPIPTTVEFPSWLSSTFAGIGPLYVDDALHNQLIVYATPSATMQSFGRAHPVVFSEAGFGRLSRALRACGVQFAPFDGRNMIGTYFTTLFPHIEQYVWNVYGAFHHSHYENEDIARIAICTSAIGITPFSDVLTTVGYVDDEATLNALAAVQAPPNLPAGQDDASVGRPVDGYYNVNLFGIQPGVAAQGTTPARNRGMYVIGRGLGRVKQFLFAHGINTSEIYRIFQSRLLRGANN